MFDWCSRVGGYLEEDWRRMCPWIFDRCLIDFQGLGYLEEGWRRMCPLISDRCSIGFQGLGDMWRRVGGGGVHGFSTDVRLIFKGRGIFVGGLEEDVSMDFR